MTSKAHFQRHFPPVPIHLLLLGAQWTNLNIRGGEWHFQYVSPWSGGYGTILGRCKASLAEGGFLLAGQMTSPPGYWRKSKIIVLCFVTYTGLLAFPVRKTMFRSANSLLMISSCIDSSIKTWLGTQGGCYTQKQQWLLVAAAITIMQLGQKLYFSPSHPCQHPGRLHL